MIEPQCNICGSREFQIYAGRDGEKCATCGSLRRHRMAYLLYTREGLFDDKPSPPYGKRILHLAPERILHDCIRDAVGAGYIVADAQPEAYSAQCLRLFFPQDFRIFPDAYFDFVIHNHVLEHLPGHFRDHLLQFCRLLKRGGCMIFSVPGPLLSVPTVEGGEHLATDAERIERFGQKDHLKQFGKDLAEYMATIPGGKFSWDNVSDKQRAQISIKPRSTLFLLWRKDK
jgi:phosphoglycolate phosphatase